MGKFEKLYETIINEGYGEYLKPNNYVSKK